MTIGEIQAGIEITRAQHTAKAVEIEAWLEQVLATGNVLATRNPKLLLRLSVVVLLR